MPQPPFFNSNQLATEWSNRICERLSEIGLPADEVEETRLIIHAFTKAAADELSKERSIPLPYSSKPFELNAEQAHEIIELFLRGVNHVAKKLRNSGKSWELRKPLLENIAWKIFNLAKLLVGFLHVPNPSMQNLLSNQKDLQLMMKQSADILLDEMMEGRSGAKLPFMPYS